MSTCLGLNPPRLGTLKRGAWRRGLLAILAVLMGSSLPAAAATVSLPIETTADPGEVVDVCITIDPLNDLIAADIDIAYDSRILDALGLSTTGLLSAFSLTYNIEQDGLIRISLFATQPTTGGGCAVNISFQALQPGCTLLYVTKASLNEGEIPSTITHGMFTVHDPVDQDGDGVSESAGDCSDRFDWIFPGATEICNGADDDCDTSYDEGVTCPCGTCVTPRTTGFWQRVCRGSSLEESIQPSYVDLVNDSATFSHVSDSSDVCTVLLASPADVCHEAESEFMTTLLNLASSRLCLAQPIDAVGTSAPDVDGAVAEIDGLLSNPGRLPSECQQAADIAAEIDDGPAIDEFLSEEIALSLESQYRTEGADEILEALVLSWYNPDAAAAGRPTVFRVYRSPAVTSGWTLVGETRCHSWFPDFDAPSSPQPLQLYQVIGVHP